MHSYEHYNRQTGIAVYTSPAVKPGFFVYFDPIESLSASMQEAWQDKDKQEAMIADALQKANEKIALAQTQTPLDLSDAHGSLH